MNNKGNKVQFGLGWLVVGPSSFQVLAGTGGLISSGILAKLINRWNEITHHLWHEFFYFLGFNIKSAETIFDGLSLSVFILTICIASSVKKIKSGERIRNKLEWSGYIRTIYTSFSISIIICIFSVESLIEFRVGLTTHACKGLNCLGYDCNDVIVPMTLFLFNTIYCTFIISSVIVIFKKYSRERIIEFLNKNNTFSNILENIYTAFWFLIASVTISVLIIAYTHIHQVVFNKVYYLYPYFSKMVILFFVLFYFSYRIFKIPSINISLIFFEIFFIIISIIIIASLIYPFFFLRYMGGYQEIGELVILSLIGSSLLILSFYITLVVDESIFRNIVLFSFAIYAANIVMTFVDRQLF